VQLARRDGTTPLHEAAGAGHAETVKVLISIGATPDVTDQVGLHISGPHVDSQDQHVSIHSTDVLELMGLLAVWNSIAVNNFVSGGMSTLHSICIHAAHTVLTSLTAAYYCQAVHQRGAVMKRKEKATPVGDHSGSLCMETVAARDELSCTSNWSCIPS